MSEPTRLERLESDRDLLESAMLSAAPREMAALVREHRAVLKELAALAEPAKGNIRDQLADKRKAREAESAGPASSEVR
jgi:hypothetical protein